jgi:hypothetical protein
VSFPFELVDAVQAVPQALMRPLAKGSGFAPNPSQQGPVNLWAAFVWPFVGGQDLVSSHD